jgi:hypothetical protein
MLTTGIAGTTLDLTLPLDPFSPPGGMGRWLSGLWLLTLGLAHAFLLPGRPAPRAWVGEPQYRILFPGVYVPYFLFNAYGSRVKSSARGSLLSVLKGNMPPRTGGRASPAAV